MSLAQIAAMAEQQNGRCGICHMPLQASDLHVDHIVHFSRGGSNAVRNLRLTHRRCNLQRGAKW